MASDSMTVLRDDLERARGYWPKLAEQTGINHSTISRIVRRENTNPQLDTFQKIRGWLDANLPLIDALSVNGAIGADAQQEAAP